MNVKLCAVFALACTLFRSAQGIIGANRVKVEDFSYTVKVTAYNTSMGLFCTGSIIHKRFIVTAGWSFIEVIRNEDESSIKSLRLTDFDKMEVKVLPNDSSESKQNEITEKVKKLHLPLKCLNSYDIGGSLAILELQNDLNLSRGNIQILKLPTTSIYNMKDYEKFAVFTSYGSNILEDQYSAGLRAMEINIVDCPKTLLKSSPMNIFCGGAIILHENINNSQNQSLGVRAGDQGGPLVWRKNTLIGISPGIGGGDDRLGLNPPKSFTNISYYIDFINDVISGAPSLHVIVPIPSS